MTATTDREIDARSIVTLILFFVVNALVLFPLRIPLPRIVGRWAAAARRLALGPTTDDTAEGRDEALLEKATENGSGVGNVVVSSADGDTATAETVHGRHALPGAGAGVGAPTAAASTSTSAPTSMASSTAHLMRAPEASGTTTGNTTATATASPTPTLIPPMPTTPSTVPKPHKRPVFTLGLATAPVAGVLILLASTCIPGSVVRKGIVGEEGVRPYDVMTLFLSFAYISLSLDCTGLLLYLALTVSSRSPPNGKSLFTYLYLLFIVLALAVGNDPIVLSGTPFVAYFTSHARIDPPTAFLFAEFQGANLASALLVSSNPTNLVLTSSFHMSFLTFSAWTALPTVAAAVALHPALMLIFRSRMPANIAPPHVVPRKALTDPVGAIFTTSIFITSIVLLIALSATGLLEGVQGVWSVTAPAAILVLARDLYRDWSQGRRGNRAGNGGAIRVDESIELSPIGRKSHDIEADHAATKATAASQDAVDEAEIDARLNAVFADEEEPPANVATGVQLAASETSEARRRTHSAVVHARPVVMRRHGSVDSRAMNIPPPLELPASSTLVSSAPPTAVSPTAPLNTKPPGTPISTRARSSHPLAVFRRTFPTVSTIISRLPLPLLPFAFSMFILVDALDYTGWIKVWALWWERYARATGAAGCIFLMGVVSVVGCNIFGTNIGATVLLSRVLSVWKDEVDPSRRALYGSILALAVGSNFGAYSFSFPASLAGLLWRDILAQKGLHVRHMEFLRWNMLPLLVTMVVGGCVVGAEVCVMFKSGER